MPGAGFTSAPVRSWSVNIRLTRHTYIVFLCEQRLTGGQERIVHVLTQEAEPSHYVRALGCIGPCGCWAECALLWATLGSTEHNARHANHGVHDKVSLLREKPIATLTRLLESVKLPLDNEPCSM